MAIIFQTRVGQRNVKIFHAAWAIVFLFMFSITSGFFPEITPPGFGPPVGYVIMGFVILLTIVLVANDYFQYFDLKVHDRQILEISEPLNLNPAFFLRKKDVAFSISGRQFSWPPGESGGLIFWTSQLLVRKIGIIQSTESKPMWKLEFDGNLVHHLQYSFYRGPGTTLELELVHPKLGIVRMLVGPVENDLVKKLQLAGFSQNDALGKL